MINFTIQDNFLITKDQLIAVFEIEPIDLILLPEEEQHVFESDMHRLLNSLGDVHIQIVMRTRKATANDMDRHFRDLTTQNIKFSNLKTQSKTSELIQGYVSELSNLLENNIIPVKEYYIVFKQQVNTKNKTQLIEAIKKLERLVQRVSSNFKKAGIDIKHTTNYDNAIINNKETVIEHKKLEKLVKSFIRL